MDNIKNVLLCGLGGIGSICASLINDSKTGALKILVDKTRYEIYKKQPTIINSKSYTFDLILPEANDYKADLIIISTKNDGLRWAISNIKNFVKKETIFLSLLNGIHSEEEIAKTYGWDNILYSFYIGNSCIRTGRKITYDGNYKFVLGSNNLNNNKTLAKVKKYFDKIKIKYSISSDINEEYWKKFIINTGVNQLCAASGLTLKEIKKNKLLTNQLKNLMKEAELIASIKGIKNHKKIYDEAVHFLLEEMEDANPSMLQDIKAKRKTEVDIFAGKIIEIGNQYNITTPENFKIYNKIKDIEYQYLK